MQGIFIPGVELGDIEAMIARAVRAAIAEQTTTHQAPTPVSDKPLLSRMETCDLLGVNKTTLWRYERAGRLSPVRNGRLVRYRRTDLERFLAA